MKSCTDSLVDFSKEDFGASGFPLDFDIEATSGHLEAGIAAYVASVEEISVPQPLPTESQEGVSGWRVQEVAGDYPTTKASTDTQDANMSPLSYNILNTSRRSDVGA